MKLSGGIENYIEKLVQDEENELVLIYGSFVTQLKNSTSDIDIYVVGNYPQCFIQNIVIDDTQLEIFFVNLSYFEEGIETSIEQNNAYYFSLLNRNIVLKDKNNLVISAKDYIISLKKYKKKIKRKITFRQSFLLNEFYNCFEEYNNLYDYFNLLEQIRITLTHTMNLSSLNVSKVYSIYNDSEKARDYFLTMPRKKFIKLFDYAIRNPLDHDRINSLFEFINYTPHINFETMEDFSFCNSVRVKFILNHMNKMINKATQLLITNNPYKDYVYHVIINHLLRFYKEINNCLAEEFLDYFEKAKLETDDYLRIDYLNKLFSFLEGKNKMDYKNNILYLN